MNSELRTPKDAVNDWDEHALLLCYKEHAQLQATLRVTVHLQEELRRARRRQKRLRSGFSRRAAEGGTWRPR
jgi:hypothetical protein